MQKSVITRQKALAAKVQTRAMSKGMESRKGKYSLVEAKKKGKQKMVSPGYQDIKEVKDIYGNAINSMHAVRGETGLIYDNSMAVHRCLWDETYPECPERYKSVMERCSELKLIERCKFLQPRRATKDEVLSKHTEKLFNLLESTSKSVNENELEDLSSNYDAIFIHPITFDVSLLAVGCTIELVDAILDGSVQNGMAIIRPPGHHSMCDEFNGYCFFNNVAVAAQHALDNRGLNKILIVDWDVHHGQGTQRAFYDDPRVLYFSIHRFEQGKFWPNLRESDFDCVGEGEGEGFNINVPLNKVGMNNADYLAIFQQLLLPILLEFQPELVMVSAGYDAAVGCPEGEMEITPAGYTHLLNALSSFACGRVAVVLEGGYCLESLAEGAALTLKTLLGDPCPMMEPLGPPSDSITETILNCIHSHKQHWHNLQMQDVYDQEELNNINPQSNLHKVVQCFIGGQPVPEKFKTRDCYPIQSETFKKRVHDRLTELKFFTKLTFPANRVCYVYDENLLQHENVFEIHPEKPDRILKIKNRHQEFNLLGRMKAIPSRSATHEELCLVHSPEHVELMKNTVEQSEDLKESGDRYNSVYFHPKTFECAALAAGSVLTVVDEVLNGESRSGICIVRPPGHHAESDLPHGFCIFNNVSIAAQYAISNHDLKRVLIVDWDVHHGNGTQHIFEQNPKVLYISLHRHDHGSFFPKGEDGDYKAVGSGAGEGFNVNIPWNKKGMGDLEYSLAFQNLIMPIAYEFNPELVLVSAGFDAAIGDPLGGCRVTPEAYGHFTHWLSALANGKIILCLEGGYNVNSISYAMTMCSKSLLGDPLPVLSMAPRSSVHSSCLETLKNVQSTQESYWKSLKFNKRLPDFCPSENLDNDLAHGLSDLKLQSDAVSNSDSKSSDSSPNSSSSASNDEIAAGSSSIKPTPKSLTFKSFMKENSKALANEEMFAVMPKSYCPHLSLLKSEDTPTTLDCLAPCADCSSTAENWICLLCFKTLCARMINQHGLLHYQTTDHSLTLSYTDLSVWCYKCEDYIDNPILHKFKNLAHISKFGEELVWSYGNNSLVLAELESDDE